MPVSLTLHSIQVPCSILATSTRTLPRCVNLMALPTRLRKICLRRVASPRNHCGTSGATPFLSTSFFCCACPLMSWLTSLTTARMSTGRASSVTLPDSSLDRSRMSLIKASRISPLLRMVSAYERCSSDRSVISSSCVMPSTPFIGVRISWLTTARNSPLARSASSITPSACSRARVRSCTMRSSSAAWAWRRWLASYSSMLLCSSSCSACLRARRSRSTRRSRISISSGRGAVAKGLFGALIAGPV